MARYVVAVKREARAKGVTTDSVRQVPGVVVKGAGRPDVMVVEATAQGIAELKDRFGDRFIVEPEILHDRCAG